MEKEVLTIFIILLCGCIIMIFDEMDKFVCFTHSKHIFIPEKPFGFYKKIYM